MQESVLTGYWVVGFMYPGRDPAVRLSVRSPMLCPKHHQREETRARAALREIAWPFDGHAAVQRPTHKTGVESPSRGRRYGSGSRWGGVVP